VKVLFVGPSLPDAEALAGPDIEIRAPACQGDVMQAIKDGATAIGLIDGQFELVAPVWHKELLFALSKGIFVFGAASMGALRAVECAAFGMAGIGRIFEDYRVGRRIDDGDVALLHAPAELAYMPLTIPLVSLDATVAEARRLELLSEDLCMEIARIARRIFFKDRTWKRIAEAADIELPRLQAVVRRAWTDQKRLDSLELLAVLVKGEVGLPPVLKSWQFNRTSLWRTMYPTPEQ